MRRRRRRKYRVRKKGREHLYLKASKTHARKLSLLIIPLVLVVIIARELNRFIHTSPIFNLQQIEVKTSGGLDEECVWELIEEPQRHLFKIDLLELSRWLEERPEVRSAKVTRSFPDKLIVELDERSAIAQVRSNRYFPVDGEGIILPGVRNYPDPDLPTIIGVGLRVDRIKMGEPYESERLTKALELLIIVTSSESLSDIKVSKIDVRDPRDISFMTDGMIEIRVGGQDFGRKVGDLSEVIVDIRAKKKKVKYIDLRFGDVAIGWK